MSFETENNNSTRNFIIDMCLYVSTFVFSILFTSWVFNAIKERKGYPSTYSKLNALTSSISVFSIQIVHALQNAGFIIMEQNYWSCKCWLFLFRITLSLSALTNLEIFIEVSMTSSTTRSFQSKSTKRGLRNFPNLRDIYSPFRVFLLIWFLVGIISIPGIATSQFVELIQFNTETEGEVQKSARCDKVLLFDSCLIDFIYELCFWTMISFLPSIVMMAVLYDWGFRFQFLYIIKPIPLGLKHQVRRIRLAFFNMCLFMILWVPMGLVLILRQRSEVGPRSFKTNTFSTTILIVRFLFMLQISIQPTIFMYAHFEIKGKKWLANICGNNDTEDIKEYEESYLVMETVNQTVENYPIMGNEVISAPKDLYNDCIFIQKTQNRSRSL